MRSNSRADRGGSLDPARYTGVAGHLVDMALRDDDPVVD
jgi:hypothetical protein